MDDKEMQLYYSDYATWRCEEEKMQFMIGDEETQQLDDATRRVKSIKGQD